MYIVVFFSLIAILLTLMESRNRLRNGMLYGFILVTVLGCIHYNYGNDYMGYLSWYMDITRYPLTWASLLADDYGHEAGWVVLNHLFSHLGGFYMMVAVLNVIQNVIYYYFIKNNVQKKDWPIAVMVYLMSTSLYILNFSMMRQGFAIALFIAAWSFIKKKRLIPSLLIILFASSIHYSAQVLFPFVLLPFVPFGKRVIAGIYVVLIIALYLSSTLLNSTFETITSIDELQSVESLDYYMMKNNGVSYGVGFVINLLPFIISMWGLFARTNLIDNEKKMLIMLSMISFIVAPFAQILQLLGRFGMYFNAYNIAAIPFIYSLLPNRRLYRVLMGIYLFMLVFSYIMFFRSDVYSTAYSTFHTVFEVI